MIGGMFWDFAWRLLLAGVLGAVIGLDRESGAGRERAGIGAERISARGSPIQALSPMSDTRHPTRRPDSGRIRPVRILRARRRTQG